jgi:hypothetical protein
LQSHHARSIRTSRSRRAALVPFHRRAWMK